jgi:hypothetical protein
VKLLLIAFLALPLAAQSATQPLVQFTPEHPRDGQMIKITWTQNVAPSVRFGTPSFEISPPPPFIMAYGGAHSITINQTAFADGAGTESVDQQSIVLGPVEAGTYKVNLQLTVTTEAGPSKMSFPLGELAVPGACVPAPFATATYQSDKSGYELHFEDLFYASVATSGPAMVTIAGTNITVRQSLTVGDIAPIRPTCISETIDVGALLAGTHHLTWIYDVGYTVVGGPTQVLTREMMFDVQAPRRRSSAR